MTDHNSSSLKINKIRRPQYYYKNQKDNIESESMKNDTRLLNSTIYVQYIQSICKTELIIYATP